MIKPLHLNKTTFPVNIIQGPLAGVSCAPFRSLSWKYGQLAFSCTEMISCKTLLHQPQIAQRFIEKDSSEGPVCYQLSSNNSIELAEAVKKVTDCGADVIDLNCGCPVKKIRRKGAGSSLLMDPQMLYQMITAMKKNTHLPVSIKIRVKGGSNEKFQEEIVKVVSEAGADFLVVHGRHWTEHYETRCHYEDIQFFVESLSIPVIGNGDISCIDSLKKMFATGCAGVMISRAGVGQPWLTTKLMAEMYQRKFICPSIKERGAMFIEHIMGLSVLLKSEKFAILQARTLVKYYARDLPYKSELCQAVNACYNLDVLKTLILRYFL